MNRKKATTAVALLVTSATLALAACSSSDPTNGSTAGAPSGGGAQVTLKLWSWRTEDVAAYNKKIFPKFEQENPGIKVDFEAPVVNTEYNQSLTTALAGSDGPDVAMVRAYGGLQGWTRDLLPLDGVVPLPPVADAGKFFGRIGRCALGFSGAWVERPPPACTDAASERWVEDGH